jgi:hypothetical protein
MPGVQCRYEIGISRLKHEIASLQTQCGKQQREIDHCLLYMAEHHTPTHRQLEVFGTTLRGIIAIPIQNLPALYVIFKRLGDPKVMRPIKPNQASINVDKALACSSGGYAIKALDTQLNQMLHAVPKLADSIS